jgi:predicted ATPase
MLKELRLINFSAFRKSHLEFCDGLNVIIGENGTGKTHLLKLGYLLTGIWQHQVKGRNTVSKESIARHISERIQNIFLPDKIGNLSTDNTNGKSEVCGLLQGSIPTISITIPNEITPSPVPDSLAWSFRFSNRTEKNILIDELPSKLTSNATYGRSVYIPTKEVASFFEGFLALYETHELQFDETYRDLALNLSSPKLKERPTLAIEFLESLSDAIGGTLVLERGRFYVATKNKKTKREITLVAEGLRKLATLLHLVENGSIEVDGTLYWDEPEANLNPRLMRLAASAILGLCKNGVQVIIATHSLFLLRELEIQCSTSKYFDLNQRYFALALSPNGVHLSQGNSIDNIDPLVVLDETLQQSERFMEQG